MAGVTRLKVQETVAELETLLQNQSNPMLKERLQVLYLLQLPEAMSVASAPSPKSWGGIAAMCNAG